jgi:hypothetical protein
MVNLVEAQKPLLHFLVRRAGLRQHVVDVDGAGTVMTFWVPKDKVPKEKGTVQDIKQVPAAPAAAKEGSSSRPAVVLVHGFAAEGIVTWQFQVRYSIDRCKTVVPCRTDSYTWVRSFVHSSGVQIIETRTRTCAGRRAGEAVRRVRAGPALLRGLDDAVDGPVPGVPGGVPGGRAAEAGRGGVHGGGVQLRRDGVVQDGGGAPGPGPVAGGVGVRGGHDRLPQRGDAGGDRREVVGRAAAAGVRQGAQGAALRRYLPEALVPRPPPQGLPRGTSLSMTLYILSSSVACRS